MRNTQLAMTIGYVCLGAVSVFALLAQVAIADDHVTFTYGEKDPTGPQHWGDVDPEWIMCKKGHKQSPINIDMGNNRSLTAKNEHLDELSVHYGPAKAVVFHDGHALGVSFGDENAGFFELNGEVYILSQLHFHSPAEHAVNGFRPPLDVHLVHKTKDGKKIAVIGSFFTLGEPSPFLDQFWGQLDKLNCHEPEVEVDAGILDMGDQKLKVGPGYARYSGSLTTPPCSQDVTWTVTLQHGKEARNTVSPKQLEALKNLLPGSNSRPLQRAFGRVPAMYTRN